jgi:long-chain acyl-CoA synthetase
VCSLGGEIGFWQGSVDKLMDDFRTFQPNILTMVPRLLNKLYDKVTHETEKKGFLAEYVLRKAIRSKMKRIAQGDFSQTTLWDRLIFAKIRSAFGGNVKRVFSTSAPLSTEVAEFSRAVFSCFFIEGYGQTECVAGAWQTIDDQRSGQIGVPTPVNHIKLIDVPDKNYFARDRVGEICIRSPAVFQGYLNDAEKTRETLTEDGWLLTGDIGRWTDQNTLKIIDRKKNIYKVRHFQTTLLVLFIRSSSYSQ